MALINFHTDQMRKTTDIWKFKSAQLTEEEASQQQNIYLIPLPVYQLFFIFKLYATHSISSEACANKMPSLKLKRGFNLNLDSFFV